MKKSIKYLIIVLVSLPMLCISQGYGRSDLYNSKGQLRIDTTLTIGPQQSRIWNNIEGNILHHIHRNVTYPEIAKEVNLTGVVIIAFYCDTSEIKNIRIVKEESELLNNAAIEGVTKIKEKLVFQFIAIQSSYRGQKYNYIGNYYLPIKFDLIDLNKQMRREHVMPIIGVRTPGISSWME